MGDKIGRLQTARIQAAKLGHEIRYKYSTGKCTACKRTIHVPPDRAFYGTVLTEKCDKLPSEGGSFSDAPRSES